MKTDYQKIPLVFNVYKPVGPSSFSIVHHFKKNLGYDFGKIGHFGTLDPFAEGVLLIGVQGAQRLNDYIHELLPKTYRAVGIFGGKTDTGDLTALVNVEKHIAVEFQKMAKEVLEEKLAKHFLGEYWQAPHSVSATKFEGKRLYEHALAGRLIQKEKVKREILDFKIGRYEYPEMEFEITVSSGTYVRSFFEEVAELLGGYGALQILERTAIGENTSANGIRQKDWPIKGEMFDLEKWGRPLDQVLRLNKVRLTSEQTSKYLQGQRLKLDLIELVYDSEQDLISSQNILWVYNQDSHLLGLARPLNEELAAIFNLQLAISLFL